MESQRNILLIDADLEFCNSIKKALDDKKYKVIFANSYISGIQKVFQEKPDLILYNIDLEPLSGYEVFKALKFTSSFKHVPIIYLKDQPAFEISQPLYLNDENIIVKSNPGENLIFAIQNQLQNNKPVKEEINYDFNRLFQLSPNGIFIFNEDSILLVNNSLLDILKRNQQDLINGKIGDLFEKFSLLKIKQWMKQYSNGVNSSFNDKVILKIHSGEELETKLLISEFKRTESSVHFIGFVLNAPKLNKTTVNNHLTNEVCNLLKRENIVVSTILEKKIKEIINSGTDNKSTQNGSFFTKRENEVLHLSMEGLSIKIIADQLSLSTRTVEKYRTKLMEKSGAKNIVEVITFSLKNNLIKI